MKIFGFIIALLVAMLGFSQNTYAQKAKEDAYWQVNDPSTMRILLFTDGLMNGYGLPDQGLSINSRIAAKAARMRITPSPIIKNMSSDGMTTSTAVNRVKDVIAVRPHLVILSVGINDAIKNIDTDIVHNNLSMVLTELQRAGIYTMIVGMQSTPVMSNYEYMSSFNSTYAKLATQFNTPFMPYILEKIAGDPLKFQNNNIFPNAAGAEIIADAFVKNNLYRSATQIDEMLYKYQMQRKAQKYKEWEDGFASSKRKVIIKQ